MVETIKIGLSDLHAAVLKADEKGNLSYGTPFKIAPAVSASITPESADDSFYADDIALISNRTISAITVELETADIKDEVVSKLLGNEIDENGVVRDNINTVAPQVALMFRSLKSNGKYKYVTLYKGSFAQSSDQFQTKEESATFQTTPLTGSFLPTIHNGDWRASVNEDSELATAEVIQDWFVNVYGSTATDTATDPVEAPAMAVYEDDEAGE